MTSTESRPLKFALGTDHAGFSHKEAIKDFLCEKGYEIKDFGTFSDQSCNYPDYVKPAAEAVANGLCDFGIVFGGSGNGEAMAANKVKGIRCALCWSVEAARLAKEHNNANLISIGQRLVPLQLTKEIIETWVNAEFEGGRHQARIDSLES